LDQFGIAEKDYGKLFHVFWRNKLEQQERIQLLSQSQNKVSNFQSSKSKIFIAFAKKNKEKF